MTKVEIIQGRTKINLDKTFINTETIQKLESLKLRNIKDYVYFPNWKGKNILLIGEAHMKSDITPLLEIMKELIIENKKKKTCLDIMIEDSPFVHLNINEKRDQKNFSTSQVKIPEKKKLLDYFLKRNKVYRNPISMLNMRTFLQNLKYKGTRVHYTDYRLVFGKGFKSCCMIMLIFYEFQEFFKKRKISNEVRISCLRFLFGNEKEPEYKNAEKVVFDILKSIDLKYIISSSKSFKIKNFSDPFSDKKLTDFESRVQNIVTEKTLKRMFKALYIPSFKPMYDAFLMICKETRSTQHFYTYLRLLKLTIPGFNVFAEDMINYEKLGDHKIDSNFKNIDRKYFTPETFYKFYLEQLESKNAQLSYWFDLQYEEAVKTYLKNFYITYKSYLFFLFSLFDIYTLFRMFRKFQYSKMRVPNCDTEKNNLKNIIVYAGTNHIDGIKDFIKNVSGRNK